MPDRGTTVLSCRAVRAAGAIALVLTVACHRESARDEVVLSGPTMGTTYAVKLPGISPARTKSLRRDIEAILERITRQMSTYDPLSEISRFNRAPAGSWFAVSGDFHAVVAAGLRISRESGGAFDVTVGPLVTLWGFDRRLNPERVPTDAEIARSLALVGSAHLQTRAEPATALRKDRPEMQLDVNGIAPGYAADRIAELVESAGLREYFIDVAGEIRLRGRNADGQPWAVAIESPAADAGASRVLRLTHAALSTSGSYRNYFEVHGTRYAHAIDPRTGLPIAHSLAAVTVLAPRALEADAWATALLVLGPVDGPKLAEQRGLAARFVTRHDDGFRESVSGAFRPYLNADGVAPE